MGSINGYKNIYLHMFVQLENLMHKHMSSSLTGYERFLVLRKQSGFWIEVISIQPSLFFSFRYFLRQAVTMPQDVKTNLPKVLNKTTPGLQMWRVEVILLCQTSAVNIWDTDIFSKSLISLFFKSLVRIWSSCPVQLIHTGSFLRETATWYST